MSSSPRPLRSRADASGWAGILVLVLLITCPTRVDASAAGALAKAMGRILAKEGGQAASEQAVKEMARRVGQETIERTANRIVREGGERSLVKVGELTAKHGPDVIRALDNAPNPMPMIKLIDDLPADQAAAAASRLAAGSAGKELATLSTRLGPSVLKAEVKHPGVGLKFARSLGSEGAELSLRLSRDQARRIGRHVDDIAALPGPQRNQVLNLASTNADRFAGFVGRFVERNPGKVLFTSATTAVILTEGPRIFGESTILYDADGTPYLIRDPGLVDNLMDTTSKTFGKPIERTVDTFNRLILAAGIFGLCLLGIIATSKLKRLWAADRAAESRSGSTETSNPTDR